MTVEILKLDGLARISMKTSSRGMKWRLPTVVHPVLHETSMARVESLPHYRAVHDRWASALKRVGGMDERSESEHLPSFTPLLVEILASVQFQEFDLDRVLATRREHAFLALPIDRVLFQTNQYEEYLNRLLDSGIKRPHLKDFALPFPFLGKNSDLDEISLKVSEINPDIVILSDMAALLRHPRKLLKYMEQYHSIFDVNQVAWAPRIPLIWIPFLSYLGVDLFDELSLDQAHQQGVIHTRMGVLDSHILKTLGFLTSLQKSTGDLGIIGEGVVEVNSLMFHGLLMETMLAISSERLRDFVRSMANLHPILKLALRLLGSSEILLELLEQNVPLQLSNVMRSTDETDVDRPEVTRYRKWTRHRWIPPNDVACCVVLPCSAKKPYRSSQSHYQFTSILKSALGKWYHRTQEIIFTSPFGGVPRALDMTHPISSYDVTVSGEWNSREARLSATHLRDLIAKIPKHVPVVVHLSETETQVVEPHLESLPHHVTFVRSPEAPTTESSLKKFKTVLSRIREQLEQDEELASLTFTKTESLHSDHEILRTVLSYEFGRGRLGSTSSDENNPLVESFLREPLRIRGKRRIQLKFYHGNKQLGTFHGDTGLVTLTLHGTEILVDHQVNIVKVNTRELHGGTVYLPAIEDADLNIVPGSPVAVVDADDPTRLLASGRALLPGRYLKSLTRGAGVTIKHKKK